MKLLSKSKILRGTVKFFGNELIKTDLIKSEILNLEIPTNFKFNQSWEFRHNCTNCKNTVSICEDFDNNIKTFRVISCINSLSYEIEFIQDLSLIFQNIELVEIEGITYLNRKDFVYEFEFQRKSSINFINYSCNECGATYLGLIRIGYPLFPEKNLIMGRLGNVEIDGIFEVNIDVDNFKK